MAPQSRTQARKGFSTDVRVTLLEQDADTFEATVQGLTGELRALKGLLIGMLLSLATACVLLAINVSLDAL